MSTQTNIQNVSPLKSPFSIEKNLNKMITSSMKGESYHSPLNYHPKYLQDEFSRLILLGNKNSQLGYTNINANNQSSYFNNVQHKYLNKNLWNLNEANSRGGVNVIISENPAENKKNDVFETPVEKENESLESDSRNFNSYNKNNTMDRNSNGIKKNRLAELGQLLVSPDNSKGHLINNGQKPNYHQKKTYGMDFTSNYKYNYQQPYPNEVYFQSYK